METSSSTVVEYQESFCLMWYKCGFCGRRERIWNSRNGVTPFMVSCTSCDGTMQHVNWELDKFTPDYKPKKGERIFIDWTREAAENFYREQLEDWWDNGDYPMSERYETKEAALESLMENWNPEDPAIETIKE